LSDLPSIWSALSNSAQFLEGPRLYSTYLCYRSMC